MTRNNRFTRQGQEEIFTKDLINIFDELAENVELLTEYSSPLNINEPGDWILAINYCASELYGLQETLSSLTKTNSNMEAMLEMFHPDYFKQAPIKNSSTLFLYMISMDIEKAASKTIVELENVLLEYMFLLSKSNNFNWKTIKMFSENTFDEEMFMLIKKNAKLFYDESNENANISSIDNNLCEVFDTIFNFYINQKTEELEDLTTCPLLINKIICKILKNDYKTYEEFIEPRENNIIRLKIKKH